MPARARQIVPLLLALSQPVWPQDGKLPLLRALQSTLEKHPQLRVSEQLARAAQAGQRQALGQFDTVWRGSALQDRRNDPLTPGIRGSSQLPSTRRSDLQHLEGSLERLLRNGITVTPTVAIDRSTDNLLADGLNASRFSFQVNVPLMAGRGREAVEARYRSTGLDADAALFDLNQTIAELLAESAAGYWRHAASLRRLNVFRESEDRGKVYLDNVRALVELDKIPPAEVFQVRANLSSRTAARIAAEQDVTEARQQLAVAMGLGEAELNSIGIPATAFPEPEPNAAEDAKFHVDRALERRADLIAADRRQESARVTREGVRNLIKPRVDVQLAGGYSSFRSGSGVGDFTASPFRGARGADVSAGISYRFPRANNTALGRLDETEALYHAAAQRRADLRRNAASAAITANAAVLNAARRLAEARGAMKDFAEALSGEREKYRLGRSSLVDVLTLEDRLTLASANEADALLSYAIAVVRLRLATGAIVDPFQRDHTVNESTFLQAPRQGERP